MTSSVFRETAIGRMLTAFDLAEAGAVAREFLPGDSTDDRQTHSLPRELERHHDLLGARGEVAPPARSSCDRG